MNSENRTVEGVVTQANVGGFQLHGREGWYNWSKYAEEPRTLPAAGDTISAIIDKAGFVREVRVLGGVTGNEITPHPGKLLTAPQRAYDARLRLDCLRLALELPASWAPALDSIDAALDRAELIEAWAKGEES